MLSLATSRFCFSIPCAIALSGLVNPPIAFGQGSEAGTPQGVDRAVAAALEYLLDQGHVEAPIRLGFLNSASERANPQMAARTLEAAAAVASRLGIPFDHHEVFRQPICDDVGKEEVGGDGCRWLLPGNPVSLSLLPAVEGERGLRLGLSVWGVLSRAVFIREQERPQGWSHQYTLLVSQEGGGAYKVEIIDVLYGSW